MAGGRKFLPPAFACANDVSEPIPFFSECPNCQHDRVQTAYTRGELILLLSNGADIEAHCSSCDECWPLSTEERADLARTLARAP